MNQRGFVEIEHLVEKIIDEVTVQIPYKVLLPIGQTWADAESAITAILSEIAKIKSAMEAQQSQQAAEPIPASAEPSAPLEAEVVNN